MSNVMHRSANFQPHPLPVLRYCVVIRLSGPFGSWIVLFALENRIPLKAVILLMQGMLT